VSLAGRGPTREAEEVAEGEVTDVDESLFCDGFPGNVRNGRLVRLLKRGDK